MGARTIPVIRKAVPQDYQQLSDIYNAYIRQEEATMDRDLKSGAYFSEMAAQFSDREEFWVWDRNGVVIGYGVLKAYSDRLGYATTCEASVYLHPEELGKGLGTQMKRHLMARCSTLGYHHIVAKILATNKASIASNVKCGFTMVGVQKEVGVVNGEWADMVIMQYILEGPPPSGKDGATTGL